MIFEHFCRFLSLCDISLSEFKRRQSMIFLDQLEVFCCQMPLGSLTKVLLLRDTVVKH